MINCSIVKTEEVFVIPLKRSWRRRGRIVNMKAKINSVYHVMEGDIFYDKEIKPYYIFLN